MKPTAPSAIVDGAVGFFLSIKEKMKDYVIKRK